MLTPDAKKLLAETIRGTQQDPEKGLRGRLLRAIHDEADRRYRLSVPIADAGLDESNKKRRERIEACIDERARATKPKSKTELKDAKDRLLKSAEKEAAATLINRLVLLRLLEAQGLSKPLVLTGGWNSRGYREFREFAPALAGDDTEGYATLLQLLFDELAVDLPGLFGDVGLAKLFPVPSATLRDVVERLDDAELVSAWTDDTTLGWVYQYWNDPDREVLDAKINRQGKVDRGKIEPHEIASKTQMFTERYMVEWLLQNSIGLTWLAMCRKRRWVPDAESILTVLAARRAEWRKKREAGEVSLDGLMPIDGELEEHWKYYVPQPIPDDAVEKAPESVRAIKILDPACGSGHFLVIAFGLLVALYREEARHLGSTISDRDIAESVLENNLHGIDIDPRAIQIAAAALYLKAKTVSQYCRPKRLNLVAPALQLGNLPSDDPAVARLRADLKQEAGIPEELTNKLLSALAGVDYLGSLLRVDAAVEEAIKKVELAFEKTHGQGDLFGGFAAHQVKLTVVEAKATILDKLERFLGKHSKSEDLGLRLDGEQLAAGVRFVRMTKEGTYDVVVGNPPYQGLSKTASFEYVAENYLRGKADLYAAFLERGLGLVRPGGVSGMVTMQGWMFLSQFVDLRRWILEAHSLRSVADLMWCAFENMRHATIAMAVLRRGVDTVNASVAITPTDRTEREESIPALMKKRAGLLAQVGQCDFDQHGFGVIEGEPILYWWSKQALATYAVTPKLGDRHPVRQGMATSGNARFLRRPWELRQVKWRRGHDAPTSSWRTDSPWVPYVKGAKGRRWIEPLSDAIHWIEGGLANRLVLGATAGKNATFYFHQNAVCYSTIGASFSARAYRYPAIFDVSGSSVFADDATTQAEVVCCLNARVPARVLQELNPTINFQVGDVLRVPLLAGADASEIFATVDRAFTQHEAHREPSVEFVRPGPSPWLAAQKWAQDAVDRADGTPLPKYIVETLGPDPVDHVSFAIGIALGRLGANGEGVLDSAPSASLPNGTLFVGPDGSGSLQHAACRLLDDAWREHGPQVGEGDDLPTYLRTSFFDFHKQRYENRPIYFPLSSAKKSFVAYVSIHHWADDTLTLVLADHLVPTRRRLEGELDDLRTAKAGGNKAKAEKRFAEVQKLLEELSDFIRKVSTVAENGPPPSDDKTTKREVDARYVMDLDDGVMVNSAALWPLLEPQWKEPKKWWKELVTAQGKKNFDWSHVAARYFPTRVRKKCNDDPSLAVAHKCFWELHPAKAYAWEQRLQGEIRPDFRIDEPGSDVARAKFLKEHDREAKEIIAKELKRRERKNAKEDDEGAGPLFEAADDEQEEATDG